MVREELLEDVIFASGDEQQRGHHDKIQERGFQAELASAKDLRWEELGRGALCGGNHSDGGGEGWKGRPEEGQRPDHGGPSRPQ